MLLKTKSLICIVIIMALLLAGCLKTREIQNNIELDQSKSLCVFYTPDNENLISNFEKMYPEYEIEKVIMAGDIASELSRGRIPDLILAQGSTPLLDWYEDGYIQDFGSRYGEDETIMEDDYFPGALEVGRESNMLLALPLSAQVPYMVIRESVKAETLFGNLSGEYTLDEYLDVFTEEYSKVIEKGTMVVSGVPFFYDFIDLLFATGAITMKDSQVEIDQAIFEKLYGICVENCRNYQEDANVSTLVYHDAAIDPRDGEYKAAYWYRYPPQVGVLYAQSVNRQLLDEEIDVFWWPMNGEGGRYAAEITTLGMIGAESENPQVAYEVLRLMMDMPVKEWVQPQKNEGISINMYMPVHIEKSKELCTYVEKNGLTQYTVKSTGNEYEYVEKQEWDEDLKESVINMLEGIEYVYRMDSSKYADVYVVATYEYIDKLKVNAATACYEDVLKIFQQGD